MKVKTPQSRRTISRPLEKNLYFGNKRNTNQSVLIDNVYYNVGKLIEKDPLKLWFAIHPISKIPNKKKSVSLDRSTYSKLKEAVWEKNPGLIKQNSSKANEIRNKKRLLKDLESNKVGTADSKFSSLGMRKKA